MQNYNRLSYKIILCFTLLCIIACSADNNEKLEYLCESNGYVKINSEYSVLNEIYHEDRLTDGKQCIWGGERLKNTGWNWQWNSGIDGINTFPNVSYGWNPLKKNLQSRQLPIQINSIQQGEVFYEITSMVTGISMLSLNLWIANILASGELEITHRIRMWLDVQSIPKEFGIFVKEEAMTDGREYDIYQSNTISDWSDFILIRSTPFLKRDSVYIGDILKFLVYQQYLNGDEYLVGINFGNEIHSGIGETKIIDYSIEIQSYYK